MSQQTEFLSAVLKRGRNAFAAYAVSELNATQPKSAIGVEWIAERIDEFVAALCAGKPELFANQASWASSLAVAHGVNVGKLDAAMQALQSVLEEELPEITRPLAKVYLTAARAAIVSPEDLTTSQLDMETPVGKLAASYLLAVLDGDRRKAISLILEAADQGWCVSELLTQVLAMAQCEIGRMWLNDEITVAEEHFATSTTKTVLAQLRAHMESKPANGKTVVVAAVPENQHDVGLQMIADIFETHGWRTISLGANVPIPDLVQAAEAFEADLLLISAALTNHLPALRDSIQAVRHHEPTRDVKILVGGSAFHNVEELADQFGADGYAADALEALDVGNRLVGVGGP